MAKFILFTDSILSARYDSLINTEIPKEAIEIDEALFFKTINEKDGIWSIVKDEVVKLPFPAPSIKSLISDKRSEINGAFEKSMQQIVGSYPSNEVSSWSKQEAEARAFYFAHNSAPIPATPLIDALAAARGVPKSELITRIIAKADMFAKVSGQLIGYRQSLEDKINALPEDATPEVIAAITW